MRKSFVAYKYHEYRSPDREERHTLQKIFGDTQTRQASTHLVIEMPDEEPSNSAADTFENTANRLILVSDISGGLTLLSHPPVTSPNTPFTLQISRPPIINTKNLRFLSQLSTIPKVPRSDYRRSRRTILNASQNQVSHSCPDPFIGPDILGTSTSGALVQIAILTRPAALLLKYLENLIAYQELGDAVTSSRSAIHKIIIDPMRRPASARVYENYWPEDMGVNGDKLLQFTGQEGPQRLRMMLGYWTWELGIGKDDADYARRIGNDVEGRTIRFVELLEGALGPDTKGNEEPWKEMVGDSNERRDARENKMEWYENDEVEEHNFPLKIVVASIRCVLWLEEVLRDVF